MNTLTTRQQLYVDAIIEHAPSLGINTNKTEFSRSVLRSVSVAFKGKIWIPNWITHDQSRRRGRGVFHIPEVMEMQESMDAVKQGHVDAILDRFEAAKANADDMGRPMYEPSVIEGNPVSEKVLPKGEPAMV